MHISVKNPEIISALVDNEVEDSAPVIDELLIDPEARDNWQRYHLVSDVLQNNYRPELPMNFADRVSAEIAAEPILSNVVPMAAARSARAATASPTAAAGSPMRIGVWKPVAGFAIAASLVAATFVSTRFVETGAPKTPANPVVENPQPERNTGRTLLAKASGTRWQTESNDVQDRNVAERLNSLLTNHLEVASMGKVQGMVLHARVVGYDSNQSLDGNQ